MASLCDLCPKPAPPLLVDAPLCAEQRMNDFYRCDLETMTWTQIPGLGECWADVCCCSLFDRMISQDLPWCTHSLYGTTDGCALQRLTIVQLFLRLVEQFLCNYGVEMNLKGC